MAETRVICGFVFRGVDIAINPLNIDFLIQISRHSWSPMNNMKRAVQKMDIETEYKCLIQLKKISEKLNSLAEKGFLGK